MRAASALGLMRGRFERLSDDSLAYHADDQLARMFIPLAELDTVWTV